MTERKLKDVSQRNPAEPGPDSDDVFGRMFRRGPSVAADGGERGAAAERDDEEGDQLKDVDQTPPHEDASANRVWERGSEPNVRDEGDDEDE